jgi:L-iditol 2-dehydrogenase
MQSVVLTGPREFETVGRDRPSPASDEVLVAMRRIGICGSDLHYFLHGRIGDHVVEEPLVLGHESAGEVLEAGSAVSGLSVGDRVTLEPGVPCDTCEYCKAGEYNLCPDVRFMATPPVDGAFTEYLAWPADFAYRLPEEVSTAEGALCEPLSVGVHAVRRGGVTSGDTVVITGCGPIGFTVMEAARAAGATTILVSDIVERKRSVARERGADAAVDPASVGLADAVSAHTNGRGADVVIEASGARPAIEATTAVARRGGTVVLVGLARDGEIPIDTHEIIDNELDVHGSFRFRNAYPTAVELLADGTVDLEGIVDFELPLADLDCAFDRVQDPEVIKGMITVE